MIQKEEPDTNVYKFHTIFVKKIYISHYVIENFLKGKKLTAYYYKNSFFISLIHGELELRNLV